MAISADTELPKLRTQDTLLDRHRQHSALDPALDAVWHYVRSPHTHTQQENVKRQFSRSTIKPKAVLEVTNENELLRELQPATNWLRLGERKGLPESTL